MGEAGAGKDSMMQKAVKQLSQSGYSSRIHEIISCTSRPMRENEVDGINYYFYNPKVFETKIMDGEMLEFTQFNNWWYGTSYESLRSDRVINIGVFNPSSVRQLLEMEDCNIVVFWVRAADKTRLLR
jgi:guanylate kinase